MTGRVVHFEVPYDDASRARDFYVRCFGWSTSPVPGMDYTLVTTGPSTEDAGPAEPGFIDGGLTPRDQAASPAPVLVIEVEDIEATLVRIESEGGSTVQGRAAVGDMGFAAYLRDTEGNVIGLWENAPGAGSGPAEQTT